MLLCEVYRNITKLYVCKTHLSLMPQNGPFLNQHMLWSDWSQMSTCYPNIHIHTSHEDG